MSLLSGNHPGVYIILEMFPTILYNTKDHDILRILQSH